MPAFTHIAVKQDCMAAVTGQWQVYCVTAVSACSRNGVRNAVDRGVSARSCLLLQVRHTCAEEQFFCGGAAMAMSI